MFLNKEIKSSCQGCAHNLVEYRKNGLTQANGIDLLGHMTKFHGHEILTN